MMSSVSSTERVPGSQTGAQCGHDCGLDRQRVHRDIGEATKRRRALFGSAEIECGADADLAQGDRVGFGQMAEMIGTENLSLANCTAVAGQVSPEIAKMLAPSRLRCRQGMSDMDASLLRGSISEKQEGPERCVPTLQLSRRRPPACPCPIGISVPMPAWLPGMPLRGTSCRCKSTAEWPARSA